MGRGQRRRRVELQCRNSRAARLLRRRCERDTPSLAASDSRLTEALAANDGTLRTSSRVLTSGDSTGTARLVTGIIDGNGRVGIRAVYSKNCYAH